MKRTVFGLLTSGVLLATTGCASNALVGSNWTQSQQYFRDVGIVGHNNSLTIQYLSKVPTLSIQGDGNTVTVEDGAWVNHVEFWGKGNTVSLPNELLIRATQVGAGNQVVRRARVPVVPLYTPSVPPELPPTGMTATTQPTVPGGGTPTDETATLPPMQPESRRP